MQLRMQLQLWMQLRLRKLQLRMQRLLLLINGQGGTLKAPRLCPSSAGQVRIYN